MSSTRKGPKSVSRRNFLKTTVAKGTAGVAVAAAGLHATEAEAADIKWDRTADVVVVGAGVSGLACACAASDTGSSVIVIEENFDIFDFELTTDDLTTISALDKGEAGRTGPNPDSFDYIPD